MQIYIQVEKQWIHCHWTNVHPFTGHLGEGEGIGSIPNCKALQPNPSPMDQPWAAVVPEETSSLSTKLPVPLHSDVRSFVVNSKLAVELLLGTQACFHCWSLCFSDHGNYGNRCDKTEADKTETHFTSRWGSLQFKAQHHITFQILCAHVTQFSIWYMADGLLLPVVVSVSLSPIADQVR